MAETTRKPRGKAAEVVVSEPEKPTEDASGLLDHFEQPQPVRDDAAALEEFNERIKSLVALFFEQEKQQFEERIADLERLATEADAVTFAPLSPPPTSYPDRGDYDDVPEYRAESESDGGTPWYRG